MIGLDPFSQNTIQKTTEFVLFGYGLHKGLSDQGVCVGDWWADRMDCRQYGAHFPHVAGIAGQANRGSAKESISVPLSRAHASFRGTVRCVVWRIRG